MQYPYQTYQWPGIGREVLGMRARRARPYVHSQFYRADYMLGYPQLSWKEVPTVYRHLEVTNERQPSYLELQAKQWLS